MDVRDRKDPRPEALEISRRLNRDLVRFRPADWPVGFSLAISKISKVQTVRHTRLGHDHRCDECAPFTAILVRIDAPLPTVRERVLIVRTEGIRSCLL
jgi:hypothetical protein